MKRWNNILLGLSLLVLPSSLWGKGWITVRSSVRGAEVMIDESEGVKMRSREECFQVEEGLHLVIVTKDGYHPCTDTVTVRTDVNHLLTVNLDILEDGKWHFSNRWVGVGGGLATGLNLHLSLFDMRWGWLTLEPCLWGMNLPFFSGVSHVKPAYQAHPLDRRSSTTLYQMAVPSVNAQLYYTPLVGVAIPVGRNMAFTMSAGPQISWTYINWSYQSGELPTSGNVIFTDETFPSSGFQFDPVWFSAQIGLLFPGYRSDVLTYFKYQDGYFLGVDFRF